MKRIIRLALAGFVAVHTASCASITFENTGNGKLKGDLTVVWVGEDRFVYQGGPEGLSFLTSKKKLIKPETFYTDGGSIPRSVRSLEGFSPWGYAPAYIIHDWLFHQKDCNPAYLASKGIDFAEANEILAEVIKALVEEEQVKKNEAAFSAISWAVTTPIAERVWDAPTAECKLKPEHRNQLERASIAGAAGMARAAGRAGTTPGTVVFRRSYGR